MQEVETRGRARALRTGTSTERLTQSCDPASPNSGNEKQRNPGRGVPVPESTWSLLPEHPLLGRTEMAAVQLTGVLRIIQRSPKLHSSQARARVLLQHELHPQPAMKPALCHGLQPCSGTGSSAVAGPRSTQAVSPFFDTELSDHSCLHLGFAVSPPTASPSLQARQRPG